MSRGNRQPRCGRYRSKFEAGFARFLEQSGIEYEYEPHRIKFVRPAQECSYTPDFHLPGVDIYIETKGILEAADRKKHLLIKEQRPDLDIRFVFMNPDKKLYKGSPTSYRQWCKQHGFRCAKREVPASWLKERNHGRSRKTVSS
jgi:hypothetical protein